MHRPLALLCGLTLLGAAGTAGARDLPEIVRNGTLRVGILRDTPRLNAVRGGGRTGLEVDLIGRFARKLGVKVAWVRTSPATFGQDLRSSRIDLLLPQNETLTLGAEAGLTSTNPYYCSGAVILSRGAAVRNSTGLLGKRIAVQPGKAYFDYLKRLALDKSSNVQQDAASTVLTLIYKTADVAIVDKLAALEATFVYPKAGLKMSYPLWDTRFGAVVRLEDGGLRKAFNKTLQTLVESGAYDKLSGAYFPQNVRCSTY
ncbi:cystine transporter subunit (plasmid) [Deinococcus aetherius]|uniref:Cystine transporter subunit n=1 Tax=Deinococcus aetherius TaxID=200252 RepID=A0ABM8AJT6_9DEIO|nr:cystine transporter subunit [Deinococcus aetherius]